MATILAIDNGDVAVTGIKGSLRSCGHRVRDLSSFADLRDRLVTHTPDLILIDLDMPFFSGFAYGKLIRRHQPRPIPILLHTSRPVAGLRGAAKEVGAVGVLVHPTSPEEVEDMVQSALVEMAAAERA